MRDRCLSKGKGVTSGTLSRGYSNPFVKAQCRFENLARDAPPYTRPRFAPDSREIFDDGA